MAIAIIVTVRGIRMLDFRSPRPYQQPGLILAPDIELLNRGLQCARFVRRLDQSDEGSRRRLRRITSHSVSRLRLAIKYND